MNDLQRAGLGSPFYALPRGLWGSGRQRNSLFKNIITNYKLRNLIPMLSHHVELIIFLNLVFL